MRNIETKEIRDLSRRYRKARYGWEKDALMARLDRVADEVRFDGSMIMGENGADSDEARDLLQGHGTLTVADSFRRHTSETLVSEEPITYVKGMAMLGLPDEDVERLATSFEKGHIPSDVIDTVVHHQAEINSLHPDKYPFKDNSYDVIANGLSQKGINTKRIWTNVMKNLIRRKRSDLALRYGYDPNPTNTLTGFLVHYALTKHDIRELNRTKREFHF